MLIEFGNDVSELVFCISGRDVGKSLVYGHLPVWWRCWCGSGRYEVGCSDEGFGGNR